MIVIENRSPGSRGAIAGQRRPDLQGMRAVAVLTVFSNHLFDWPSGGFVGVDIFFVLSGFFITGILIRERTSNRRLSFQDFYVRRVKRILPSAVLVLVVTVAGSYVLFPAIRAKETLVDALYAAVFAANFRFEAVGADYFQQTQPPSPLQHYWSLSIEEQFYFVWPALLVLIFALTRGLRRGGRRWARHQSLLAVMIGIVATSFAWAMYLSVNDANAAYFSTFTRVWELGVGALVAIAGPWMMNIPSSIRPWIAYLGLAGVAASLLLIDPTDRFPAPWAALPVVATALVIASFHGGEVRGLYLLSNPVARWFGDTSYTLYLWHWPVIILLFTVIPKGPLFFGVAIALSLGLTAVTYHFYEDPIRKSHWLLEVAEHRSRRRLPTLGRAQWALVGGVAAVVIVNSILAIGYSDREAAVAASYNPQIGQQQTPDLTTPAQKADPCYGAPAMVTPGCHLRDSGEYLSPSLDQFSQDTQGALNCYRKKGAKSDKLPSCEYGYEGSDAKRIALVGDSHAASILPALWPILNENKWRLTTYLGQSCGLTSVLSLECKEMMAHVQSELIAHPYDLVLTTNLNGSTRAADYQTAWAPIAAAGSPIAVLADNPRSSEEALACLTRVGHRGDPDGECATPRNEAMPNPDALVAAAAAVPGATLIDLTRYYCTSDRCPSIIGDVIVYRDYAEGNSHITATYAKTLAPPMEEGLKQALTAGGNGRPG